MNVQALPRDRVTFHDSTGCAMFFAELRGDTLTVRAAATDPVRDGQILTAQMQVMPIASNEIQIERQLTKQNE
jgi:hypothetical protein